MNDSRSQSAERSRNFTAEVSKVYPARKFPPPDAVFDRSEYDSEGSWAFCRFTDDEVLGLRAGFQCGQFDLSDYGIHGENAHLQLHLEVMTKDGAYLWLPGEKYPHDSVESSTDKVEIRLRDGRSEILRIKNWPAMSWQLRSADGLMSCNLEISLEKTFVAPDLALTRNVFSMCIGVGTVTGTVGLDDRNVDVSGCVFHDHPRITVQESAVEPRQWYLYTPQMLSDGSYLILFYTANAAGDKMPQQTFGVHIGENDAIWLGSIELEDISYDDDDIPCAWTLSSSSDEAWLTMKMRVRPTRIARSWGSASAPAERKDFVYIPLVSEGRVELSSAGRRTVLDATGLAEYWRYPD